MTTKILALTDALGNLVRFHLMHGHRFDTVGVAPLIDGIAFGAFVADKAFDSNDIVANLNGVEPEPLSTFLLLLLEFGLELLEILLILLFGLLSFLHHV
jgi:hypothetical protein